MNVAARSSHAMMYCIRDCLRGHSIWYSLFELELTFRAFQTFTEVGFGYV